MYPTRRPASQHSKMFRFLNAYNSKTWRFANCRHPKIGTFSGVGWSSGGGFQRGRIFEAPLWPHSLVTFLAEQESNIIALLYLLKAYTFSLHPMESCSIIKEKGVGFVGKLETLKQWVAESSSIVFFGGAGVSTEYRT